MAVFAVWHGGSSYSVGDISAHLEKFASIAAAKRVFAERARTSGAFPLSTYFVNRENTPVRFPAVDENTSMDVYAYDPRETADPYPDFRLVLGPKGGVRRENY